MDESILIANQIDTLFNVLSQCSLFMGDSVVLRAVRQYLLSRGRDVCLLFSSDEEVIEIESNICSL